jgi:glycolate oxidase FAD binding subunit
MRVLKPDTEEQVVEAIRDAKTPLAVEGRGTKQGFGRPAEAGAVLRLAGLSGMTMYEPDEMVFTAKAGTPLAEIEAALAQKGQCLGFEPGEIGMLWDAQEGGTIGGAVAAAIAGPRRFAAGAARDHLLGFVAINGAGERFKAGGRVVKNVTGYDVPKLAAGSFGTLFAMTEVTLRALPRGQTTTVLALDGKEPAEALRILRAVAASPFEPSGLIHLATGESPRTLIRLEGQSEGVAARAAELTKAIAKDARALPAEEGAALFRTATNLHTLFDRETTLWRASVPPTRAHDMITRVTPAAWFADAAGGILWFEYKDASDPAAMHAAARDLGGHATLVRKGAVQTDDVFPPLEAAALALTSRVKAAFDPGRRLNPGRMYKDV